MKNSRQILVIIKSLQIQKDIVMCELIKTNSILETKTQLISKMRSYLKEYTQENKFEASKASPSLYKNLNLFMQQIEEVIDTTLTEVDNYKSAKQILISKIEKLDQKVKLMNTIKNKIDAEEVYRISKLEQLMLDDMAATKHLRN